MPIEQAAASDLSAVRDLLAACGLPVEDVVEAPGSLQFVSREDGGITGTVGVDVRGNVALLRSLAVQPARRGRGLGVELMARAERHAVTLGARRLFLLTESADALAVRCGFAPVSRCVLGADVLVFRQFSAGCCAGASCYLKHVGSDDQRNP